MSFAVQENVHFTLRPTQGSAPAPAPILVMPIVELTQAQYDALETYDANTLYAIPEEVE